MVTMNTNDLIIGLYWHPFATLTTILFRIILANDIALIILKNEILDTTWSYFGDGASNESLVFGNLHGTGCLACDPIDLEVARRVAI